MNDLISRQWLMGCVNEGWIKFDTEKDENRFIHLVRDIAPSAQPEQQWIPCSEQMPVEGGAVWVTIAGHDLIICKDGETIEDAIDRISKTRWVTQGFFGSDGWYGADGYPMMVRPIAWMPLEKPKAYEGE